MRGTFLTMNTHLFLSPYSCFQPRELENRNKERSETELQVSIKKLKTTKDDHRLTMYVTHGKKDEVLRHWTPKQFASHRVGSTSEVTMDATDGSTTAAK